MRRTSRLCLVFFLSILLILSMPIITKAEDWAVYGNETNVSYPAHGVNCSLGYVVYPTNATWWCWINYSQKVMDHSFMTFEAMDAYYNSSGEGLIIGGETYTLSAFQDQDTPTEAGPGLFSSFIALIQSFF